MLLLKAIALSGESKFDDDRLIKYSKPEVNKSKHSCAPLFLDHEFTLMGVEYYFRTTKFKLVSVLDDDSYLSCWVLFL